MAHNKTLCQLVLENTMVFRAVLLKTPQKAIRVNQKI